MTMRGHRPRKRRLFSSPFKLSNGFDKAAQIRPDDNAIDGLHRRLFTVLMDKE
jgi:hypothetical protein